MLGLVRPSSARWIEVALGHLDAILADHAHCEMKAASNALSLAVRAGAAPTVASRLVDLAEEELSHFRRVLGELERRGLTLGPPSVDPYAAKLRCVVRANPALDWAPASRAAGALVDRLLVAALIEARSCERFRLLAAALETSGPVELSRMYEELLASEARHHLTLVDLARTIAAPHEIEIASRLGAIARWEGEIVAGLGDEPTIHG